jgi:signal transduction histidine kinase
MNPMTAVAFLLASFSFWLQRTRPGPASQNLLRRRFGQVCAAGIALIGLVKLSEYLFGWELGIDLLLYRNLLEGPSGFPGRMAANTALCFTLVGLALLFLDAETHPGRRPAEWLTLGAALVAGMAVIGYAYQMQALFDVANHIPMSLNTAIAFLLLATAILSSRADRGLMRIFLADSPGGVLARRLFPTALLIPVIVGWLGLRGERTGLYDAAFGVALFATVNVAVFIVLLYWTAASLGRLDAERKLAQEELERQAAELTKSNMELEATNKELDAFTYSVSHDLRSPLRQIDGFSRILQEELSSVPPQARHCLERIQEGVAKMGRLVDDLLNLGRVGRKPLHRERTPLNALVQEAVAELEPEAKNRAIDWQIDELPVVECDPGLLKLVFVNLLSNAIKFTQNQPRAVIQVGQQNTNGERVFFVRDTGIGFNMRYAHKLFGIFQRLHRQEDFPGVGVGLANVQRIIHKHGGRVWAHAEPYKGATFYFTLGAPERNEAEVSATLGGAAWQPKV